MSEAVVSRLALVAAVIPLAVACGASDSDSSSPPNELRSGDASGVPSGCEDVLRPREALPQCDGAICDQVQREPQRSAHWLLTLQHDYAINDHQFASLGADVLEHQLDCVLRQLQRLGVTPVRRENPGPREYDAVTVDASFEQIRSVLESTNVSSMELSCVEADCQRCDAFSEQQCRADAFCWPVSAQRLDAARGCWEERYAGCYRGNTACGDASTHGVSSDGACWQFPSTCQPRGFSAPNSPLECGDDSIESVPRCER